MRRSIRSCYPGQEERDRQSHALCRHILVSEVYLNARVICGYIPLPHEADVIPVLQDALRKGKTLLLPRCGDPPCMTLHQTLSLDALLPGKYSIPEPSADWPIISPTDADLFLVPLEGIDKRGIRLGKGGGYYDRLLAKTTVISIGCALKSQRVDLLPADPWDHPLHACADADGLCYFKPCTSKRHLLGKEKP